MECPEKMKGDVESKEGLSKSANKKKKKRLRDMLSKQVSIKSGMTTLGYSQMDLQILKGYYRLCNHV